MVTVRDLFYKVKKNSLQKPEKLTNFYQFPVRRKSIHQEKCIDMVRKTVLSIALAFSHVSFSLLDGALGNKLLVTKRVIAIHSNHDLFAFSAFLIRLW